MFRYKIKIISLLLVVISIITFSCNNIDNYSGELKMKVVDDAIAFDDTTRTESIQISFSSANIEYKIQGVLQKSNFFGSLIISDSDNAPLNCSGKIKPNKILLKTTEFSDHTPLISVIASKKNNEDWKGKLVRLDFQTFQPINKLLIEENVLDVVINEMKLGGDKLNIRYPVFGYFHNKELFSKTNSTILKSILNSFSPKKIKSIIDLESYYDNEMEGSVSGNIYYNIISTNKNIVVLKIKLNTMSINSDVDFPSLLHIDLETGENISLEDIFNISNLTSELTGKFIDLNEAAFIMGFKEAKGKFIPVDFIETENGVTFFNNIGIFSSSIFLPKEIADKYRIN